MSNTAEEKTNLVLKVLRYAQEHDLDITNKDHVQKILAVIYPSHRVSDIEEFMGLLRDTNTFMEMNNRKKSDKNTNLPN